MKHPIADSIPGVWQLWLKMKTTPFLAAQSLVYTGTLVPFLLSGPWPYRFHSI